MLFFQSLSLGLFGKGSLSYCFNSLFSNFKCLMSLDLIHKPETFRVPASMMGIGKKLIINVARVENPLKRILNTLLQASFLTTEDQAVI